MADPVLSAASAAPRAWRRFLAALLLLTALLLTILWPLPAWGLQEGPRLFELHCSGCHPNGGNVIRRGRTLRQADLLRRGIEGEAAIATIAAAGIGGMDGYAEALGEGGPEAVAAWVWQQAQAGWQRQS
jgi:cytochrome c6